MGAAISPHRPISMMNSPTISRPQDHSHIQDVQMTQSSQKPSLIENLDPFHTLIQDVKQYFQSLPETITSLHEIDVEYLKTLMSGYESDPQHWEQYAYSDPSKHYTRNCVADLGGRGNLLMLVWNPNKSSPVHDHARAHCVMKILQGTLKEEIFTMPPSLSQSQSPLTSSSASSISSMSSKDSHQNSRMKSVAPLQPIKETIYRPNEVTYICDDIGLHRISNPAKSDELAISLHLYTPPNAADFGYSIYEEKTGKRSFVRMSM